MPDFTQLSKYVNPIEFASYWDTVNEDINTEGFLSASKFPSIQIEGLDLAWYKGASAIPLALQPSALDVKATIRGRIGVSIIQSELPFFKESMVITERERQMLLQAMATRSTSRIDTVLARIYRDAANLVLGARVQRERMVCQILSNAAIDVRSNHDSGHQADYIYNFDPDGTWNSTNKTILTGTDEWTVANAATATPLDDIEGIVTNARRTRGVIIREAVMTTATLMRLYQMDQVRTAVTTPFVPMPTNAQMQAYIEANYGIRIILHDAVYRRSEDEVVANYWPDGVIAFLPAGALGEMVFGTTPAEADLQASSTGADSVTLVDTGVAVYTRTLTDPVNVQTFVAQLVLPTCPKLPDIYVLNAFSA